MVKKGRLNAFSGEFGLPPIPLTGDSIHVIKNERGDALEDIREVSHNETVGDFIANFIREKTQDLKVRLHCSIAGGRKTMSFYLGSALQLFGRPWDRLYHVLVSPEFESHPEFYYKPRKNKVLELMDSNGKVIKRLHTKEAQILIAELPFIRLRDKIPLNGKGFKELVREGQKEIDIASIQPLVKVNLSEKVVYIGQVGIDPETLRQNISKINKTLKENIEDETLHPHFIITPIGKHGSKRYGIRAEKGKIGIE